jgi:hypothetical protein
MKTKSKTVQPKPQQQERQQFNSLGEEIEPEPGSLQAQAEEALFGFREEDNQLKPPFWATDHFRKG